MIAVVLLGSCEWNSQVFIGASYVLLNLGAASCTKQWTCWLEEAEAGEDDEADVQV